MSKKIVISNLLRDECGRFYMMEHTFETCEKTTQGQIDQFTSDLLSHERELAKVLGHEFIGRVFRD